MIQRTRESPARDPCDAIPVALDAVRTAITFRHGVDMSSEQHHLAGAVRLHLLRLLEDAGLRTLVPPETLDQGLTDLELGLGQLLADVERARRKGVSLGLAVHAHEQFPYLGRFHGFLHDAFVMELPSELAPIMRRFVGRPPPGWIRELMDQLCVVVRATAAQPEERAFARLLLFEEVRLSLSLAAYQTNGGFEGVGGCRRDLDEIAGIELDKLLDIPLELDATTPYRPLITTVAAAMSRLAAHVEHLREVQRVVENLGDATHERAELEMLLRTTDPVDATILRHRFDRAAHQQPIPLARLPLEHPLVLAGHTEASIYQRSSRAMRKLTQSPSKLRRATKPLTLPELLLYPEDSDA